MAQPVSSRVAAAVPAGPEPAAAVAAAVEPGEVMELHVSCHPDFADRLTWSTNSLMATVPSFVSVYVVFAFVWLFWAFRVLGLFYSTLIRSIRDNHTWQ